MIRSFKDLRVYKISFEAAMELFKLSKSWPKEERYALTDQIRRSSRSVTANLAEAWSKRRYPKHFISKMTDALAEASETEVWLDYALACKYIEPTQGTPLLSKYQHLKGGIVKMIAHPERWCVSSNRLQEPLFDYDSS